MRTSRSPLLRLFSIFIALVFSSFLTGCGGGGGGGGNSPVSPLPTGGSTIEGFVSLLSTGASLRAAVHVANQPNQPLIGASCELFAFDPSGQEHKIADAVTNEQGFYRFTGVVNTYGNRNLVIRAKLQNKQLEGILPLLRDGALLRAQTIDPESGREVAMVRHAARTGRQSDLNLGELFALLSPKALAVLDERSSLETILDGFLARQEARRRKLGPAAEALGAYAFELQQTLQEMIERGEVSAEDAWNWFDRKLTFKAHELGIPDDKQMAIDTLDQALVFEPATGILEGSPELGSDLAKLETERLRERKLRLLDAVSGSMKILVGADPSFTAFFTLIETLRARVERCTSATELHRLLKDAGQDLVAFSDALGQALLKVRFTPELVSEVFATPVPQVGLGFVGRAEGTTTELKAPANAATKSSPMQFANDLLDGEDALIERLIVSVKTVASRINLQLTPEEMKAIAWLILAQSPENLNFPQPPMPTTPGNSGTNNPSFTVSGDLRPMPEVKEFKGFRFTHKLLGHAFVTCKEDGSTTTACAPAETPIAFLSTEGPVEITTISPDGKKSLEKRTLADLGTRDNIEVYGRLIAREASGNTAVPIDETTYLPMPMPQPKDPMPLGTVQTGIAVSGSGSASNSGSSSSSTGSTGPSSTAPGTPVLPVAPTALYLVVERIVILPPPAPAPESFTGLKGRVVQAEALGRGIPGLFVLETSDPASPCRGAVLHSGWKDLESIRFIRLNDWAGKYVTLSGTLIREVDQRKAFLVTEIAEQQ